jgi:hypothetical protein
MQLLAIIVGIGLSVTSTDQAAIDDYCTAQWGNLLPLKNTCITGEQAAASELRQALSEAQTRGWLQDIEKECSLNSPTNYGKAASCVSGSIEYRKWEIEDRKLALRGHWSRPENVPEEVFLQVRDGCIKASGLRFHAVQGCINHIIAHSGFVVNLNEAR